jgi:hypothetical protein
MVERPIKKADRQPQPENNDSANGKRSDDSDKKRSGRSDGGRDKRDKRGSRDEETKAPVNLALVRGPKPTKPQPEAAIAEEEEIAVTPEVSEEDTEA